MSRRPRYFATIAIALAIALPASSCTESEDSQANTGHIAAETSPDSTTTTRAPRLPPLQAGATGWSATAKPDQLVRAYSNPGDTEPMIPEFPYLNEFGDAMTFRIWEERYMDDNSLWYRVQLPVKPNNTDAWIRAPQVTVTAHSLRLVVDVNTYTVTLLDHDTPLQSWQVGVGKASTPTPRGSFFLWTKWGEDVTPAYGRGVLGLSSFTEAIPDWPGGGRIGIHGTYRQSDLGRGVSHGCVRMLDSDLTALWDTLTIGMPVDIV